MKACPVSSNFNLTHSHSHSFFYSYPVITKTHAVTDSTANGLAKKSVREVFETCCKLRQPHRA